ncbi:MAG: asparagine synthase (glutamine-hydrolyzing) [Deltaproteobacteria bacterium]|nr:asparagine synthase (glutamine-hydrolyzing) [Deltaproteobacteria bacterium]
MCGIAGELSFSTPVDTDHIKLMMDAIAHRGPDDEGVFCEGSVGLGHRRLSIIDLSPAGHQPMWSADKSLAIVFNGEVYNYREIRPDLEAMGYHFKGNSDTEVVLNAIHCWGIEQALQKFIGMFAFAVWDARERCLILARDRAGIKPLFYSRTRNTLIFGSELKALYAHPGYQKRLDRHGLGQYFILGYTLDDATVLADTFRVPAGHFLRVGADSSVNVQRYWSLDIIQRGSFAGSFDEAVEEMERLAESSFAYRLVSDVPVGVFLSGGIDSTFLAAILKKRIGADLLHITIGFRDARYDEAPMATQIATELGLHHEVRYLDAPDAVSALRRFADIYDEPFGDSSGMPTAVLSAVAREYVKVALSADGGDEQFCGYESYPTYTKRYRQMLRMPLPLRRAAAKALAALPYERLLSMHMARQGVSRNNPRLISTIEKAFEIMRMGAPSDLLRIMNEKGWSERKVSALLGEDLSGLFAVSFFASRLVGANSSDSAQMMDSMMRSDYQSFLRDDILTKVDRASMAVSLECRDPFLDHRLAEFAYSLPMEYVYSNGEHKRILKHILRRWVSEPVLKAPKRGFVVPLYEWMRGPWRQLVQEYLSRERIRAVGALDENVVGAEVKRFYRYAGIGAEKLLLMLNFQMWAEQWYCS